MTATFAPTEDQSPFNAYKALNPVGYIRKFTDRDVRPDGRDLRAARPTTVVKGVLPRNSFGSALVRLGETQVLASVTLLVGTPSAGLPDCGDIEVRLLAGPLCGGKFNLAGRVVHTEEGGVSGDGACLTDPEAIESLVQRTVRSSGCVDLTQLCIERGRSAWRLKVGLTVLNHDGNIIDAAFLSAVAALADVRLPRTRVERDGVVRTVPSPNPEACSEGGSRLLLKKIPVPLTVGLFEEKMIVDPTSEEEMVCQGCVTAFVNTVGELMGLTKLGETTLKAQKLAVCVRLAIGRARELEEILLAEQNMN